MARKAELVISRLVSVAEAVAGATVERNPQSPIAAEAGDRIIVVRDGDPGEPEEELSVTSYTYAHAVEAELYAVASPGEDAAAELDQLITAFAAALAADPYLGGLCETVEPMAPEEPEAFLVAAEGEAKGCLVRVICTYETSDPLS